MTSSGRSRAASPATRPVPTRTFPASCAERYHRADAGGGGGATEAPTPNSWLTPQLRKCPAHGGVSSTRTFPLEHLPLPLYAPSVAGQAAVSADYPMAGNDERQRIRCAGGSDSSNRIRAAD